MFGKLPSPPTRTKKPLDGAILSMNGLYATGGRSGLKNCNVTIRRREVVGLAGLEGSGQGIVSKGGCGIEKISKRRNQAIR